MKHQILLDRADAARLLYKKNLITREEAIKCIKPYVEAYNTTSKEIAKKYNMSPKKIHIASFLR